MKSRRKTYSPPYAGLGKVEDRVWCVSRRQNDCLVPHVDHDKAKRAAQQLVAKRGGCVYVTTPVTRVRGGEWAWEAVDRYGACQGFGGVRSRRPTKRR